MSMSLKIRKIREKINNNDFWKTLFSNSFFAFLGDSGASVINLIITIVLIRLIGNTGYGILVLAQSYMLIMDALLNVQSWKSTIQYGQKALLENKKNEFYGYVKTGCILDLLTAVLGGVVAICFSGIIGKLFGWNQDLIICCQLFSFTIFSHFAGTPTAILRIFNKFNLVAIQKILSAVVKLIFLCIILIWKSNISVTNAVIVYVIGDIIGNLLLTIFAIYIFRKKYSITKLIKSKLPKDYKQFIYFTLWGTASEIADLPIRYFDVFIVSFLNIELVAVYKVFQQIVSIFSKVTSTISQAILPQFSSLSAQGLKERGYEVVIKIRNAVLIIVGSVAFLVGLSSPIWLNIIYGKSYADYWYVLLIYLLTQTILLSYSAIHPYFLSLGKSKQSAIYGLIANIIYMILAISLIRVGGLLSLIICIFIQGVIVISLKVRNIHKVLIKKEEVEV